jgi:hypothetical protein
MEHRRVSNEPPTKPLLKATVTMQMPDNCERCPPERFLQAAMFMRMTTVGDWHEQLTLLLLA